MASSSTSSIHKRSFKYDVFLSFRGEDTRKNFVDHLYYALDQKSIHTYKDDERIEKGKNISDELIKSIQDSKFFIIVFSKNYASSSWCLDELVKIMEFHKTSDHTAFPIFYDVEPSEVRKQSGEFGKAFSTLEIGETADKWRDALEEAAALAGWELKNIVNGHEAKFIQKIVEEVSLELRSINFSVDGKLIGMETRVKDVVSSLETGFDDVRMIGIKGMGGGGKTTLARAVFDQIYIWFEGKSFVENVREVSKASLSGLKSLQKQVLLDVLNDQGISVNSVFEGKNMMKKMMCCRKILVVLDDVDHIEQLEALAGEPNWFAPGSRIIITTRDEQVLVAHRVNLIHDVNLLSHMEAICLFSRHAFGREIPIQGYEELSGQVVRYAAGLPLTIRVLGSFLLGKNELEWIDALERLKTIPLKDTLEKLELSYISLEEDYKEIFLDVACILKGWDEDDAIRALESCGFHARNGLRVLEQRSLITISEYGYLGMHDHIEEMGRNIVRRLHPDEPNKHSRLWIDEEIKDVLVNDLDTNEATRCIKLRMWELIPEIVMKGFGNMKKLRFLQVSCGINVIWDWKFDEVSQYFPNALRYLRWNSYPFWSLPKTFQANNLVALEMSGSKIVQLWEGGERKVLKKLRFLDLKYSKLKTLDLGLTPNLETLSLLECLDLVELLLPLGCLKLRSLDIGQSKLRTLDLVRTPNLEKIRLVECVDLVELHIPVCLKLISFDLYHSKLRTLDLRGTPNIETLSLRGCYDLVELYIPVKCVKLRFVDINISKLRTLDLVQTPNLGSSKLRTLDLRGAPNLETLSLRGCYNLVEIHIPVKCAKLRFVNVNHSKLRTRSLVQTPNIGSSKLRTLDLRGAPNLVTLSLRGCYDLVELHIPVECLKLKSINIMGSKLISFDLGWAPNLKTLSIKGCYDLVELHMPVGCLKFESLNIMGSELRTLDLQRTSNLEIVSLLEYVDLVELHITIECLKLISLDLSLSKLRTLDLGGTMNLKVLSLERCDDLVEFHMPVDCLKLKSLNLSHSKLRTLDLGGTPNLEMLSLEKCEKLVELHMPVECLKLRSICLSHSKLRTLDLSMAPNLEMLSLTNCYYLAELHAPVGCLERLDYLDLSGCLRFKSFLFRKRFESLEVGLHLIAESLDMCPLHFDTNLPKFRFTCLYEEHGSSLIGNLEKLISFGLCACTNLERFSQSICGLRCLTRLTLEGCIPEAPKDLDQLECLEEVHLLSTKITHFPDSICKLKHLKCLELNPCWLLEKLPEALGRLECLEKLILSECVFLRDIPNSICKLKRLEYFHISYCIGVEKLPEELGRLECLKELNIEGTGIRHLPQSIFLLKGLRIVGFKWLLELCGFTSEIQTSEDESFCYIEL